MEVKVIGHMDNTIDHTFESANRIYDTNGIAPTISTCGGGGTQPKILKVKKIGNYMKSNYDASRVVDVRGVAPCVKENHGTVTAIVEVNDGNCKNKASN